MQHSYDGCLPPRGLPRRKRSCADSSPRYRSLMIFSAHGAVQIDVDCFVSDPHRSATQLDRFPVFALHQLIVLKSLRCLFRCQLERFFQRRLARFNSARKALAKHAYRTEFHRSRKFVAAVQASALGLRAHRQPPFGPDLSRKQHHAPPIGAKSGRTASGKLLSRSTNNCVFIYPSASNQVSEQDSRRDFLRHRVLITTFGDGVRS